MEIPSQQSTDHVLTAARAASLLRRHSACEGKTLRAHKVVLSACSTYFDTILSQYEEKDPIVIMRDVKFSDIKVLVEFMYKGEINIDHTRLSSLLKTAEDLHIKGLAEVSWRSDSTQNDLGNSGHSPGAATPGVETVLREGDADEPPPPKQRRRGRPPLDDPPSLTTSSHRKSHVSPEIHREISLTRLFKPPRFPRRK